MTLIKPCSDPTPGEPSCAVPLQAVADPWLAERGMTVKVLRCDLLDPLLAGNKWYKLKYNLRAARAAGGNTLLSFGGAWSNHLHALAAAGRRFGFRTIGIVRGEEPGSSTACLIDAAAMGMTIHRVSRADYRRRAEADFIAALREDFGGFHLIPEGGANALGIFGCGEMLAGVDEDAFDLICLACGTGTTLCGLVTSTSRPVLGFQVLKGAGYLKGRVEDMLDECKLTARAAWSINVDYHCGGYARVTPALLAFITRFEEKTGIELEPVYSGKMLLGLYDLIARGHIDRGSRILVIHGGGLQGKRGFD